MFGIKIRTARVITSVLVIGVVLLGVGCKLGVGTLCSFGPNEFSYACPLGILQVLLAGQTLWWPLWISLAVVAISIVLLGRFFCAWICPTALLRTLFGVKESSGKARPAQALATPAPDDPAPDPVVAPADRFARLTAGLDTRHAVLGGALVSSLLFGFPVFCLICPIGLFFGALFAVTRLFSTQQPSLELLLLPALLALELFALKSWCRSICPLGALLSLASRLNPFFRPTIQSDKCLTSRGTNCQVCFKACPERIDLHAARPSPALSNCTKCHDCADRCPVKAINFPLRAN